MALQFFMINVFSRSRAKFPVFFLQFAAELRPFRAASPSETLPTLLISWILRELKLFKKITCESMFMVSHKVGLSVAATLGYYAIKVNVHEGRRREERTMHSLSRELLPCQSNKCYA